MGRISAKQAAQLERGEITTKDIIDLDQQELQQLRQENERLRAALERIRDEEDMYAIECRLFARAALDGEKE